MKMLGGRKEFLRFQTSLISLERGNCRMLEDDRFVTGLAKYLFDLYRSRYFDSAHGILHMLGSCTVCDTAAYREKALFILSLFAENVVKGGDDQAVQALSWIFSRWLRQEHEYLGCFEHVCNQIQALLKRMLDTGRFCQLLLWEQLFGSIARGELHRLGAMKAMVGRMHAALALALKGHEPNVSGAIRSSVEDADCLRRFRAENSVESMVEELYQSTDKERRLALIAALSRYDESVAYVLLENLGANSPWYAIRNAVHIISRLKGTRYFNLVKSFLEYPDVRVQQQVLAYIARLDRERALEQLVRALEICDDSLKAAIIRKLSTTGRKAAQGALLRLLENRIRLNPVGRDELLLVLCGELRNFPSVEVVKALNGLIAEREMSWSADNDPVLDMAKQTIALLVSS